MTDPGAQSDDARILAHGVELFNRGAYWDAHEAWEELWLRAGPDLRLFVQGLIQLAAAWYHVGRGNRRGAERLFRSGLEKLAPYRPLYAGIDLSDAVARAETLMADPADAGSSRPLLRLTARP